MVRAAGFEPTLFCLEDRCLIQLDYARLKGDHYMSKCTTCKVELNETNAYRKGTRLNSRCKQCFNSYCMQRWITRKLQAIEYKGNACHDCKQSFPYPVYDFHHLDPTLKDMDWNKMRLVTDEVLKQELDKCVLLCSNCHRLRHHNERIT